MPTVTEAPVEALAHCGDARGQSTYQLAHAALVATILAASDWRNPDRAAKAAQSIAPLADVLRRLPN